MLVFNFGGERTPGPLSGKVNEEDSVTHIVLFSFQEEQQSSTMKKFQGTIQELAKIEGVIDFEFGKTFTPQTSRHYTHALIVRLQDQQAENNFELHELHQNSVKAGLQLLNKSTKEMPNKLEVNIKSMRAEVGEKSKSLQNSKEKQQNEELLKKEGDVKEEE